MSYLVLARKWRPRNFEQLVGQEHVLRALVNAFETGRVHHAFLFTGTRGVGKTTIARILAKSLNCETGMTARPCGVCTACVEIDEGRFVDLIEVDAASRTKVDDTRELLDNVQYLPARGRYKVYLIDEVHMLSTHSFNALLKTLEEPPPHVKFLLATTDPQKLPVTVLSRCLQFNLKRLPVNLIVGRLSAILQAERIDSEPQALRLLATAAQGSMRDALSLLDQVIAFGGNRVSAVDTAAMLGTVDRSHMQELLEALATQDVRGVLRTIATMDEHAPDYRDVLADLASQLQKMAIYKAVPDWEFAPEDDVGSLQQLAQRMTPEDIQLYYQFAITGRRDLELAPEPRAGFEMTLLRMIAFQPQTPAGVAVPAAPSRAARTTPDRARDIPVAGSAPAESATDWSTIVGSLKLQGGVSQLAAHCTLVARRQNRVKLLLDAAGEIYRGALREEQLAQALTNYFGEPITVEYELTETVADAPARRKQVEADHRLQAARKSLENDPQVRAMQDIFGAVVQPDSVKPV